MCDGRFGRTELLVGSDGIRRLAAAHAAVFGLGGVGSYAAEALARAGVGRLLLVDFDTVEASNQNRQLVALESTVGQPKVLVAAQRIADINPDAQVETAQTFVDGGNASSLLEGGVRYVIDAIDSVQAKTDLLHAAHVRGLSIVSCMGAANKLDPTGVTVADLSRTTHCPLARVVRQRLRKRGVETGIRCVFSTENQGVNVDPTPSSSGEASQRKQRVQGSISYVPGIVGLIAAGVIVNDILGTPER